jgi:hypothetical protein
MTSKPTNDVTPINVEDKVEAAQFSYIESVDADMNKPNTVIDTYRSYSPDFRQDAEKKLVRKIDKRLLPLVVVIYLFNYLDRNSITQARLYGLQKDTHVNGAVYQTAISIFSAGYIAMQLPSVMLMTKLRPSIYLVSVFIHQHLNSCLISPSRLVSSHGPSSADVPVLPTRLPASSRSGSSWVSSKHHSFPARSIYSVVGTPSVNLE